MCFQKAETELLRQHPDALEDYCIEKLQNRQQTERVTKPNESRDEHMYSFIVKKESEYQMTPI